MKPLERVLLQMLDWREQSKTDYVLYPPSGDRSPVAVDRIVVGPDGIVRGYIGTEPREVVALPADCNWILYRRDLVQEITIEDAVRQTYERRLAVDVLEKELVPEGTRDDGARVVKFVVPVEDAEPDLFKGPGQYL